MNILFYFYQVKKINLGTNVLVETLKNIDFQNSTGLETTKI